MKNCLLLNYEYGKQHIFICAIEIHSECSTFRKIPIVHEMKPKRSASSYQQKRTQNNEQKKIMCTQFKRAAAAQCFQCRSKQI